ncbi:DUF4089 domain-containing protein [Ancylobacter pratisalsi]|uniref:DUF4089 domain-containing protein n=1 Tax=Ancylobacter pratisalsi TaxID=1745854 RepID=A0A6P1YTQ0_9HYPH|nr:DUF4089 domain-containing protein [Ancylobacter pratisalsi]QIB35054.1 DUF4089 domain-containing protein [Ancylobacter pratisalsi]
MDGQHPKAEADLGAFLDAALAVAELPLEPELRPRVLMHLRTAVEMAQIVTSFPLSDEAEPAPVYLP